MNRSAGFTLLEVLLSVAIIGMLVSVSIPVYASFVQRNDLGIATQSLAALLRRAETYARAANYDDTWGVEMQAGTATLFRGSSFASRNTAYDEALAIPASIASSGLTEIQFAKFTAAPNTTGSITLTSTTNDSKTVTINSEGTVDY